MDPDPDPAPAADQAPDEAAALSLRSAADLPPDFAADPPPEIDEAADEADDDEGYATAASRAGSSTAASRGGSSTAAAWKEEEEAEALEEDGYGDAGPPSPSSSGYAGERGSSLASSANGGDGIEEEDDEPDAATPPHAPGAEDWARDKKHADEIVFLVKGPIYLVCISCTEESFEGLRGQLELMYGQMLLILTKSVNRCFEKNPKFDMAPLLGGTDAVFLSLIRAFSWNPATFLHAYTCLPLPQATRQAASAVLQDIADSGVLFALLMCEHKVISLVGAQKATLHPDDILLLANFILSSESFRTSESFSPICLPRYNPMAFLYAYVHFFDENTYVILLTPRSDAFYDLKDSRARIQDVLLKSNVLLEVQRSLHENVLRVEDVPIDLSSQSTSPPVQSSSEMAIGGPAGLWHFIYKSVSLDQYVSSEFASPIRNPKEQKRLYKAYQKFYASMHDKATGPHRTQFRRDEDYVLFCWITQDFELYAAFHPLADKTQAIKICNRVCQWIRDVESKVFVYGESTLAWQYHQCWGDDV